MNNAQETHDNSNIEYIVPSGEVVYSATDTSGKIKAFNRSFLDASGYTPDELLGKTHSILKHPDVPTEVYNDMWETISSGNTWSGIIKNRRKDGSYYWVDNSITPIIEDGFISGYASIRYAPSRDMIARAEEYYKRIKNREARYPSTKARIESMESINHRDQMNYYLAATIITIAVMGASHIYDLYVEHLPWVSWVVLVAIGFMLFFLHKINQMTLLEEPNEIYNAIKDLSAGKFKSKLRVRSRFAPYLELLRIRNGNMNAVIGDCEFTKSLNSAILDNILGGVVTTDHNFNVTDYNLSASTTLLRNVTEDDLENKESYIGRLTGANLLKILPIHLRDVLRKREKIVDVVVINDRKYRVIVQSIRVRDEIKGWIFIFYQMDDSGNFVDVTDRRRKRD